VRLQHPFEVVTPTLDGDVLNVLAGADEWFATQTITSMVPQRSQEGIRKTLKRLVSVGIVEELSAGRAFLFRLNREHLAAEPILQLASLKQLFFSRLTSVMTNWEYPPLFAAIFGSAARNQMTAESDVDLFLIQPTDAPTSTWDTQVEALITQASKWIGSDVRPLLYTESEVARLGQSEPVFEFIAQEGVPVFGERTTFTTLMKGPQ
jgi:predicted nucleotidyltransferase